MSVARYRERHSTSGAKSDAGDAHVLAEIVRLDHAHHRPVAGDSDQAEAMKLVARTHQTLIWDRSRQMLRLRSALREFFPAALDAFDDLTAPDTLELLGRAPDPDRAARLSRSQIAAALRRANRRDIDAKAASLQHSCAHRQLRQPAAVEAAYAAIVTTQVRLIAALNAEIEQLGQVVADHFGRHRDAEILPEPARPRRGPRRPDPRRVRRRPAPLHRRESPQELRRHLPDHPGLRHPHESCWPATPATEDSSDALHQWAFCSLKGSPGARAYYDSLRARGTGHQAALRQLGNRLVGILHGCLKTGTPYNEATAWAHLQSTS